jgi:hypothetical protein
MARQSIEITSQAVAARRWPATSLVAVAIVAVSLGWAGSAFAAESPQWKLTAVATPTNIAPGSPRDEVQKVTVDATGGTYRLAVRSKSYSGQYGSAIWTGSLPYNATAAEVQAALDGAMGEGESGAAVTGGPGVGYVVTFQGGSAGYPVEPMQTDGSGLTGGTHSVVVTEVTRGLVPPLLVITATNVGGAATDGSTINVEDALPSGVTATNVVGSDLYRSAYARNGQGGAALNCAPAPAVSCAFAESVDPGDQLVVYVTVNVADPAVGASARVTVSGGGAPEEALDAPFPTSTTPALYGPAPDSVLAALSSPQAGAHPNLTTQFTISTSGLNVPVADERDIRFDLPPGLVGSTVGTARCSMSQVVREIFEPNACPADSMVGTATLNLAGVLVTAGGEPRPGLEVEAWVLPVYNIAPSPGEPAAFAFDAFFLPVRLDTSVLSNGDYGVRVTAPELPETKQTISTSITIWGVPAQHNGPGNDKSIYGSTFGGPNPVQTPVSLLTSPQQCTEPLIATMATDSWTQPGVFASESASMGTLTGCGLVPFSSSFTFLPDTLEAGAPAGYAFDLTIPQKLEPNALATSSLKNFTLKLPVGVVVNPSAAWGLKACSRTQFYGSKYPSQEPAAPAECPREAQVGEVEVETPDLEKPLKGQVFLAEPECGVGGICTPADAEGGKMVRLYVQLVGAGEAGIVVKLEGQGHVDQKTGQITTVFDNNPQVPFNRMHFVLGGGPRAVLANPRTCGTVTANGDLTPWNTGPGVSDSLPFYELDINQGCFGPQFAPSFVAGMPNIQAGAYGPFTLAFGRSDHDQFLAGLSMQMPAGLLGRLQGVELCKEAQASVGTCGPNSLIGHVQALTGPGADPFLVSGGQVFITEGYGGAPYGLSIVVPAVAGPYTLAGTTGQGTVVVRAKIVVDPHTAALTVTSDPLPTMLDGIPLQLKAVNVVIDRPSFTFNPTSCAKTAITGTLSSAEGMSAGVGTPFQVTNCAVLAFKPNFTASTSSKTSRKNGANLDVKLSYPIAPQGTAANLAKVKVELPKALPSRLPTLQKACPAATFESNPAGCPPESIVGHAKATTPLVPVPIEGPAYFVSHGGEAFPSLIMVLQGYGLTLDLVGSTYISKSGITSSTFKTIPDAPVGTFELMLPQGPYSALAANTDLCRGRLAMGTELVAQNGAVIHQSTPIVVSGCRPAIKVLRHAVSGRTATITVSVPSAGTLVATGRGLARASAKAGAAGTVTLKLTLSGAEQRFLAKHHGRRLKVNVALRFTPAHGGRLRSHVSLLIG